MALTSDHTYGLGLPAGCRNETVMEIDRRQAIELADSALNTSEGILRYVESGDLRYLDIGQIDANKLGALTELCGAVGEVGQVAVSIVAMIRDIKRIETEAATLRLQLEGRIKLAVGQLNVISRTLAFFQELLLRMPDDYSDRYLMEKKSELINRIFHLTMKVADLV